MAHNPILFYISLFLFILAVLLNIIKLCLFNRAYSEPFQELRNKKVLYFKHKNTIIEFFNVLSNSFYQTHIYKYFKTDYKSIKKCQYDSNALIQLLKSNKHKLTKNFLENKRDYISAYVIYIDKTKNFREQLDDFIFFIEEKKIYIHLGPFLNLFYLSNKKYLPIFQNCMGNLNHFSELRKPNKNEELYFITLYRPILHINNILKYNIPYFFFANPFICTALLTFPLYINISISYNLIGPIFLFIPLCYNLMSVNKTLSQMMTKDDDNVYISDTNGASPYVIYNRKQDKFFHIYFNYYNDLNPNQTIIDNLNIHDYRLISNDCLDFIHYPRYFYQNLKDKNLLNSTICINGYPIIFYIKNFETVNKIKLTPTILQFIFRNFKLKNNPFKIISPYNLYRNTVIEKKSHKKFNKLLYCYTKEFIFPKWKHQYIKILIPFIRKNKTMPIPIS